VAWRRGEGTAIGIHLDVKYQLRQYRQDVGLLEKMYAAGVLTEEVYQKWRCRLAMGDVELNAHLRELYPGGRHTEPRFWRDPRFNRPSQPVSGVSWYEARAYCAWLGAQSGSAFRLPSEVEWEAATCGAAGRKYAYGGAFDATKGITLETRLKRPAPVGVFIEGTTPEGVSDLGGNMASWTKSLWGDGDGEPVFKYPYDPTDGREAETAALRVYRVVRGAEWWDPGGSSPATARNWYRPDVRSDIIGVRLARSVPRLPQKLISGAA